MSQEKMPFIRELYEGFVKGAVPAALEQLDQSIEWMRPRTTSMRIASPTAYRRRARSLLVVVFGRRVHLSSAAGTGRAGFGGLGAFPVSHDELLEFGVVDTLEPQLLAPRRSHNRARQRRVGARQ